MSGRAWTAGPWHFRWDDNGFFFVDAPGRPSPYIAATGSDGDVNEANARLIAAAPDMAEALNSLAGSVGGLEIAEDAIRAAIGNTNWSVLQAHLADARAALAKATEGASHG